MQIDLLYFDDCPSWQPGLDNLKAALVLENNQAEINLIKVDDNHKAEKIKFLGSPSFQIDGIDLWPEERENYTLSCRVYSTPNGMRGVPTVEMLRYKLQTYKNRTT
jgi:hypothetical protein